MAFITATSGSRRSVPRTAVAYVIVGLIAVTTIAPFLLMVSTSLTTSATVISYPPKLIPDSPSLKNYGYITTQFNDGLFTRWLVNSVIVTAAIVIGSLILNTFAGYVFAKKNFQGKSLLFGLILSTLFIPAAVKLIPSLDISRSLGLYDTFGALILPAIATPIGIFMMRQFIGSLPSEIFEAAKLDGASEIRILFQMVVPMCRPGLAALAIVTAVASWNDFLWPLIALPTPENQTLPVGFANLATQYRVDYGSVMAGAVLASIPLLILFISLQRHFVEGIRLSPS